MNPESTSPGAANPRLSLIIPVLNEAEALPAFLAGLESWRDISELILVDGGSSDDSVAIAEELADRVLRSPPGRGRQMNLGAAQARGQYLLFLHSDTQLQIDPAVFLQRLEQGPRWGFFAVRLSGRDWRFRIIERAMSLRSRLSAVATGDQGLFLSRDCWADSDGFAEIALMEDVEFCKRLRRLARPCVVAEPVITSSRRWEARGIFKTVCLMWYLRLRYWLGASPETLARIYRG